MKRIGGMGFRICERSAGEQVGEGGSDIRRVPLKDAGDQSDSEPADPVAKV